MPQSHHKERTFANILVSILKALWIYACLFICKIDTLSQYLKNIQVIILYINTCILFSCNDMSIKLDLRLHFYNCVGHHYRAIQQSISPIPCISFSFNLGVFLFCFKRPTCYVKSHLFLFLVYTRTSAYGYWGLSHGLRC